MSNKSAGGYKISLLSLPSASSRQALRRRDVNTPKESSLNQPNADDNTGNGYFKKKNTIRKPMRERAAMGGKAGMGFPLSQIL